MVHTHPINKEKHAHKYSLYQGNPHTPPEKSYIDTTNP